MPPTASLTNQIPKPDAPSGPAWAAFDSEWYLQTYGQIVGLPSDAGSEDASRYYLEEGQRLGHSPNPFFDEAWFLRTYPDVAAAVSRTEASSGFDWYRRKGHRNRSPHYLFDERLYRKLQPDLTDEALQAAGLANGYDHYLRHGDREQRRAHLFFDPAIYQAGLDPEAARQSQAEGSFRHYLRQTARGGYEARTTLFFDPHWYLGKYPEVAAAIERGIWRNALHHYLTNETPTTFDPLPEFSESYYLARYPDIAAAVEAKELRSGYKHFLTFGAAELRSPSETIDLRYYADHSEVRAALRDGRTSDCFTHYLASGRAQGLPTISPPEEKVSEAQAKALFRRKATGLLPLFARQKLDFTCSDKPAISVIVIAHNRFALTLMALWSLRSNYGGDIELILVDSGSTDELCYIRRYLTGATILRFDSNIGFVQGCNAAFQAVSADMVLLLNNDIELAPGAISAGLNRLRADPSIGAVGGKVIRTHGLLQEAGNIVWRNGTTTGYMRDASPLAPEANFVREVDFCSAVFLMLPRSVLDKVEGFDEAFAPAYYEDADLCLRIAAAGWRVVFDPSIVVHHLEYGSAQSALTSEAAIERNRLTFCQKHEATLSTRSMPDSKATLIARLAGQRRKRLLFIEDTVPLRRLGSGFVRSNDILHVIGELGYQTTVFPINGSEFDPSAIYGDIPDTIEVMHNLSIVDLPSLLAAREGYYDAIWITRTHNLDRIRELIARDGNPHPPIILDTEAVTSGRTAAQAQVLGQEAPLDLQSALKQEFANAGICEQVLAVSNADAAVLHSLGLPCVKVVGHMRAAKPRPRPFNARSGILFVGAMHEMGSPNYDSLCWFVDEVLPRVEVSLGWETRLTVVGYTGRKVSLDRFSEHPRVTIRGAVAESEPLYDAYRLFVAPTRFAAGAPYKLYEAASLGLPVVTTDLLRRQMGWEDGTDLLSADSADPEHFAEQVVRLYRDPALWQRLRENALRRISRENGKDAYMAALGTVLGPPFIT